MKIKEAKSTTDAQAIADIYKNDSGKYRTTHTLSDVDKIYKSVLNEFSEIGENRVIFIGYEENVPIGTVQLILKRADNDPELANGSTIAHIHHLRVGYRHHKSGKGKELMEYVEKYAREHGIQILTLGVDNWNTNAIGFYEHLGYKKFKDADGKNPEEQEIYFRKKLE